MSQRKTTGNQITVDLISAAGGLSEGVTGIMIYIYNSTASQVLQDLLGDATLSSVTLILAGTELH